MNSDEIVRLIAFYLPQYHPVPENDEWWGKGFTEWTNVTKAKPLFPGHYQPHLPADLGFYDLRLSEAREAQAQLARTYGIYGFCYYHYWFNGRRILERPFNEVLASGKPDFPFCLCWANENWTKRWDGLEHEVLLAQQYSPEDDLAHIKSLLPALRDERYIRVNNRPLLLVWRTELMPDPIRTAQLWRKEAIRAGIGDLFLVRVEGFMKNIDPETQGFDAAVEFAPDGSALPRAKFQRLRHRILAKVGLVPKHYIDNRVYEYADLMRGMLSKKAVDYLRFRGITPGWDNSARRSENATIINGATPEIYGKWLSAIIDETTNNLCGDEQMIFINAWNEWAEGAHLEPDRKFGLGYLEETRIRLNRCR